MTAATRQEASRVVDAGAAEVFAVLCDPAGHVEIDSSGMLQDFTGEPVSAVGDTFVVHMDREALGDLPIGRYDVTVTIETFEPDSEISWSILGTVRPGIGHRYGYTLADTDGGTLVTSFCDWSNARPDMAAIFPVVPQSALRATLGILDRVVRARRTRLTPSPGTAASGWWHHRPDGTCLRPDDPSADPTADAAAASRHVPARAPR